MPPVVSRSSPFTKRLIRLVALLLIGCVYGWVIWKLIPWMSGHRYNPVDRTLIAWICLTLSFGPPFLGCIVAEFPMADDRRTKIIQTSFIVGFVLPALLERSRWPTEHGDVSLVYQMFTTEAGILAVALAVYLLRRATK